jgi:uncharacterized protein (TIGR03435 family)
MEGDPGTNFPGQWTCKNIPLSIFIFRAWDLRPYQFSAPRSASNDKYDIVAIVPPNISRGTFNWKRS